MLMRPTFSNASDERFLTGLSFEGLRDLSADLFSFGNQSSASLMLKVPVSYLAALEHPERMIRITAAAKPPA